MAGTRLMRLALLRNPTSFINRTKGLQTYPDTIKTYDLDDPTILIPLLHQLRDEEIECLVIDGGDGTVREVANRLLEIFGDKAPLLGVIARGNTNLVARKLGSVQKAADLDHLVKKNRDEVEHLINPCRLLRLDFHHKGRPPLRGFIAGWGAYSDATLRSANAINSKGKGQVIEMVLKTLAATLFSGRGSAFRQGVRVQLTIDGEKNPQNQSFIGLVTTLSGPLSAGLNPFWNTGNAPIRWTEVLAPAPYLFPASLLGVMGKSARFMDQNGYASGTAHQLRLSIETPLILDGEVIEADEPLAITISAQEMIQFITTGKRSLDKNSRAL